MCPQCKKTLDNSSKRLVQDACGHKKCRQCLLSDEEECKLCHPAVITLNVSSAEASPDVPSHIIINKKTEGFTCTICKKNYRTSSHMKDHFYCAGGDKPYKCVKCAKEFTSKYLHQTHLLSHEDSKPFNCDKCHKGFYDRGKFNRHKLVHSSGRPYVCAHCGNCFKNKDNLQTHSKIHNKVKPFSCTECDAKFNHVSNLKKHQQTHMTEKTHMCDLCGKRFKLKWGLSVHRKIHLKERLNECKTCGKAFTHMKDLTRHLRTHEDLYEFVCGLCQTVFKRKDNLSRHSKNAHPGSGLKIEKRLKQDNQIKDTPNAINVITVSPSFAKTENKKEPSPVSVINATPDLTNVDLTTTLQNDGVNKYEKILLPNPSRAVVSKETEDYLFCQKIFAPFKDPLHYETSFDNKQHAVIKNIKFKLPAKYTNLKNCSDTLLKDEGSPEKQSVIVNSNVHWRRRTAEYFNSKENEKL